jgi:hypothetical protein
MRQEDDLNQERARHKNRSHTCPSFAYTFSHFAIKVIGYYATGESD